MIRQLIYTESLNLLNVARYVRAHLICFIGVSWLIVKYIALCKELLRILVLLVILVVCLIV